ncbi:MAG: hypothetical protein R3F51_13295 [Cyanobacteriota/Melainabacteria group bacterium]
MTREGMEALKDTIIEKVLSTSSPIIASIPPGKPMPCFSCLWTGFSASRATGGGDRHFDIR